MTVAAAKPTDTSVMLLDAIQSATELDLAAINNRLGQLDKERAALIDVKKIISHRLFGKQKRASPAKSKTASRNSTEAQPLVNTIYDLIALEGPGTANQIAVKLTVKGFVTSAQQVGIVCGKCDWFQKDEDNNRWTIARKR